MRLHYDVAFDNTPLSLPVEFKVQGSSVMVAIGEVPDVGLSLSPTGGGLELIMAAVLDPIAELLVSENMGSLDDMLGNEAYELTKVNSFEFSNMMMTAESLSTGGHSVDGKPVLKIVPVLSIAPIPASAHAAQIHKVDNHVY